MFFPDNRFFAGMTSGSPPPWPNTRGSSKLAEYRILYIEWFKGAVVEASLPTVDDFVAAISSTLNSFQQDWHLRH